MKPHTRSSSSLAIACAFSTCLALWLAACGGGAAREFEIEQYADLAIPGVDGATVYLGDVSAGAIAPVSVKVNDVVIAMGRLRRGDELPFVSRGNHVLTVVRYTDRLIRDRATLRIEHRRPSSPQILRLALGTTEAPAAPGLKLTVETLEPARVQIAIATETSSGLATLDRLGEPYGFEYHGTPYVLELLAFDGPSVYVRVAPRQR